MYKIESHLDIKIMNQKLSEIVAEISKLVNEKPIVKNAGHESEKELADTLGWSLLDYNQNFDEINLETSWDSKNISKLIEDSIKRCQDQIYYKDTNIFVFPTFSKFVKTEMDGVSGFTPDKNVMNVFVHRNYKPKAILETVTHEYAHSISYNFDFTQNLLSSIVLEGLAEVFSEKMTGQKSRCCQALNYEDSMELLKNLPLEKEGWDEVRELFTGAKKYPLWAGYSISYFLIKEYLEKNNISIEEALLISPEIIGEKIKTH